MPHILSIPDSITAPWRWCRWIFEVPGTENRSSRAISEQWLERVRELPGVDGVALASRMPLSPGRSQTTFRVGDRDRGTRRRCQHRVSRILFTAGSAARSRAGVRERRERRRTGDRIHSEAITGRARTRSAAPSRWTAGAAESWESFETRGSHGLRMRSRATCICPRRADHQAASPFSHECG